MDVGPDSATNGGAMRTVSAPVPSERGTTSWVPGASSVRSCDFGRSRATCSANRLLAVKSPASRPRQNRSLARSGDGPRSRVSAVPRARGRAGGEDAHRVRRRRAPGAAPVPAPALAPVTSPGPVPAPLPHLLPSGPADAPPAVRRWDGRRPGQHQTRGRGQRVAQFHRHERVEPQLLENVLADATSSGRERPSTAAACRRTKARISALRFCGPRPASRAATLSACRGSARAVRRACLDSSRRTARAAGRPGAVRAAPRRPGRPEAGRRRCAAALRPAAAGRCPSPSGVLPSVPAVRSPHRPDDRSSRWPRPKAPRPATTRPALVPGALRRGRPGRRWRPHSWPGRWCPGLRRPRRTTRRRPGRSAGSARRGAPPSPPWAAGPVGRQPGRPHRAGGRHHGGGRPHPGGGGRTCRPIRGWCGWFSTPATFWWCRV